MNLYEKATNVASEILSTGMLGACALVQTNPQRSGSLNLMHESLRRALDSVRNHESEYPTQVGLGPSRLTKTVGLVEHLRQLVDYGVFRDLHDPPYRLDEAPQWRTKIGLIKARVDDVLRVADAMAAPDPRTLMQKVHDHLASAEALWHELPEDERDQLCEAQTSKQDLAAEFGLGRILPLAAAAAEQLVEMEQAPGMRPG